MRHILVFAGLAALVLLLTGQVDSQAGFSQDQLDAWQTIAASYYTDGVDENAMLGNPWEKAPFWAFRDPGAIQAGMTVPDFTLMDLDFNPVSLSDYQGEAFVLVITGSWY